MTETTTPDVSILLVEDDANTRVMLERAIEGHDRLRVTASVGTLEEGRRALDAGQPRVLLVDLGLPDGDGTDLIREIYQRGYATDVMVITVFGDEPHVIRAIEAGATGYLLKDERMDDLCTSILQLIEGGSPISAPIARHLLSRFTETAPEVAPEAVDLPDLTEREQQVLSLLARGFSFTEIAAHLGISPHTVSSHIKHIYRKLAVRSRSEAVFEAVQLGLIQLG